MGISGLAPLIFKLGTKLEANGQLSINEIYRNFYLPLFMCWENRWLSLRRILRLRPYGKLCRVVKQIGPTYGRKLLLTSSEPFCTSVRLLTSQDEAGLIL